jgi:hypothetical protein
MHNWFECKISYDKATESGMLRKVTEAYLVDALSFTEAETLIIEKMRPQVSGDFMVMDIKRARFAETFLNDTGDRFYRIKVNLITLDEKSGTEKETAVQMLVQASTIHEAISFLDTGMKGTITDYVIASVTETALMDVFPFEIRVKG